MVCESFSVISMNFMRTLIYVENTSLLKVDEEPQFTAAAALVVLNVEHQFHHHYLSNKNNKSIRIRVIHVFQTSNFNDKLAFYIVHEHPILNGRGVEVCACAIHV